MTMTQRNLMKIEQREISNIKEKRKKWFNASYLIDSPLMSRLKFVYYKRMILIKVKNCYGTKVQIFHFRSDCDCFDIRDKGKEQTWVREGKYCRLPLSCKCSSRVSLTFLAAAILINWTTFLISMIIECRL